MLTPSHAAGRREDGLGLVELMIAILIMGVVGGITVTGLVRGMQTTERVDARIQTSTELQKVAERVARDLRRGVWTDTSLTPPPTTPPAGCTFLSLDPNELTLIVFDGTDRYRHRYVLTGQTLTLDVDQWVASAWADVSNQVVTTGLTNIARGVPLFTYLDREAVDVLADGLQGSDHASVRSFRLNLVGAVNGQPDIPLSTTVAARNGGLPCPVAT